MEKVSVIIPVHNSSEYIEECITSVVNQTYKNIEIIVVDDNSSDNSLSIIKSIKDKRIKVVKLNKNSGVAIARNKGIDKATGNYICFLDSDDYWYLDKLEKQVKFMEDNDYAFIYSNYLYLKGNHTHIAKVPKEISYKKALGNTTIFTSTVMLNMKKLKKKDIYMPLVIRGQDSLCWWNILSTGIIAYGMNDVLSVYRVRENSLSSNKFRALKRTWNLYKYHDISYFKKLYYFSSYVFNAIKRRLF